MKKLFVILLLLVSGLSFSQEKKKTLDKKINTTLDSLSKIYKKKVYGFGYSSYRGVKETTITYLENGKGITKVIKTEFVGTPVKENE
jgi:hypothetical protein